MAMAFWHGSWNVESTRWLLVCRLEIHKSETFVRCAPGPDEM